MATSSAAPTSNVLTPEPEPRLHGYERFGAHLSNRGVRFEVWAPNASYVAVVGDFNRWDSRATPMESRAGVWSADVAGVTAGARYKYYIEGPGGPPGFLKADPYAFGSELRPNDASLVCELGGYEWGDERWDGGGDVTRSLEGPLAIYEVHLGSWAHDRRGEPRWLTYREVAPRLAAYVRERGFTHVELLPVAEHPLDASWGYQVTGYYAPTSRYGTPQDFMYFVDTLHRAGIGVIMDWVPGHFPRDAQGLRRFDGTPLYEYGDPRLGDHPDWGTHVFDYTRPEVRDFLIDNALFWFDRYHLDGLRVDAVASMLYRDYSRPEGAWVANEYGGRENLEAVSFLRELNERVYERFPSVLMIAEESTAWPMVSRPTYLGGLGFLFKWNMGWMNDVLRFMGRDPVHRGHHLNELTFGLLYAYHENFILPLSHDEVAHGKGSIVAKMPGDDWQQFANARLLYGYMYGHPGKKVLFMGDELGLWDEWDEAGSLNWSALAHEPHQGMQRWISDLNGLYTGEPALWELDYDTRGFEWVDYSDTDTAIVSFLRRGRDSNNVLLFVCNFTPVPRFGYRVGVPLPSEWEEVLNSDDAVYWGSGLLNDGVLPVDADPMHSRRHSLELTLPPLATIVLRPVGANRVDTPASVTASEV